MDQKDKDKQFRGFYFELCVKLKKQMNVDIIWRHNGFHEKTENSEDGLGK